MNKNRRHESFWCEIRFSYCNVLLLARVSWLLYFQHSVTEKHVVHFRKTYEHNRFDDVWGGIFYATYIRNASPLYPFRFFMCQTQRSSCCILKYLILYYIIFIHITVNAEDYRTYARVSNPSRYRSWISNFPQSYKNV